MLKVNFPKCLQCDISGELDHHYYQHHIAPHFHINSNSKIKSKILTLTYSPYAWHLSTIKCTLKNINHRNKPYSHTIIHSYLCNLSQLKIKSYWIDLMYFYLSVIKLSKKNKNDRFIIIKLLNYTQINSLLLLISWLSENITHEF